MPDQVAPESPVDLSIAFPAAGYYLLPGRRMRRQSQGQRHVANVIARLLGGDFISTGEVMDMTGLRPPAARRLMDVVCSVRGVTSRLAGRERVLQYEHKEGKPERVVVVGACIASCLARLFRGSRFEEGIRRMAAHLVEKRAEPTQFEQVDRKFVLCGVGGEIAIRERNEVLEKLVHGVLRQTFVSFQYRHFDGRVERISIAPLSIGIHEHQLYVIGRPRKGGSTRPYPVARIARCQLLATTFEYPTSTEYDPDQLFQHSLGMFVGDEYPVVDVLLRISNRWRAFVQTHRWHPSQHNDTAGGELRIHLHVRKSPGLVRWILGFGREVEVLKPDELREEVAATLADGVDLYRRRRPRR